MPLAPFSPRNTRLLMITHLTLAHAFVLIWKNTFDFAVLVVGCFPGLLSLGFTRVADSTKKAVSSLGAACSPEEGDRRSFT